MLTFRIHVVLTFHLVPLKKIEIILIKFKKAMATGW